MPAADTKNYSGLRLLEGQAPLHDLLYRFARPPVSAFSLRGRTIAVTAETRVDGALKPIN